MENESDSDSMLISTPSPLESGESGNIKEIGEKMAEAEAAEPMNNHVDFNNSSEEKVYAISYFPDDSQLNFWMFAMIGLGCSFIIFVAISLFIMCRSGSSRGSRPKANTPRSPQN